MSDKFIYPSFNIHSQANCRWSITGPPLQQLPPSCFDYTQPKKCIIRPRNGEVWIGHDWTAIEPRVNACLSNDLPSLEAMRKGWDLHTINMVDFALFDINEAPPDLVRVHDSPLNKEWLERWAWKGSGDKRRKISKQFGLRLDYGGDPEKCKDISGLVEYGLKPADMKLAAVNYLMKHPGKAEFRDYVEQEVMKRRELRSWTGRPRKFLGRLPSYKSRDRTVIREAFDSLMQIGVSEIHNDTILQVKKRLPYAMYIFSVHDALWFGVPEEKEEEAWPVYKEIVQQERVIGGIKIDFPAEFKRLGWRSFL